MIDGMYFDQIKVGATASFERTIIAKDVSAFAEVSGDQSPIHVDEGYAKKSGFSGPVVHGMLLGALVSRLIGMDLPGRTALLVKETLEFRAPAYIGDVVSISGTVTHKTESARLIEVSIEIRSHEERIASGSVVVLVREESL
jgi:acyl dehydratase